MTKFWVMEQTLKSPFCSLEQRTPELYEPLPRMTEQKSKGRVFFMSPLSSCAYLRATYLLKTFCYISKVSLLLWGHNLLYFFSYSLLNTILNNPLQIILTNSHVCIWIQWLSFVHRNGCNFSVPLSESNSSGRKD